MAESTEIAIPQGQWRQELNSRMRALLEEPPFEPEPEPNSDNRHQTVFRIDEDDDSDDDHYYLLDAELYNSAKQGGGRAFLDALERVSELNKVRINRLLTTVSLGGDKLLHIAARNGNADVVDLIITHFPSLLNEVNLIGDTAVHVAAKSGEVSVLQFINSKRKEFLNSGGHIFCGLTNTKVAWLDDSLKKTNRKGNTPLHEALINGHPNLAVELVEEDVSVSVVPNVEGKSAFYLAAEAGYIRCLLVMMDYVKHEGINLRNVGKSPIHAAILGRNPVALWIMLDDQRGLINLRDDEKRTPLHFAALMGYDYAVNDLIMWNNRNVMKRDKDGQLPIHLASTNGHIDVIEELLKQHYNPQELLNGKGQNILHVAAVCGKYDVVNYILKHPQELIQLINQKDDYGNMPLHLATMNSHPKIVSALTLDKRVDLHSTNNKDLTALDAAQHYMDEMPTFRQQLTWLSLIASGASRYSSSNQSMTSNIDKNTNKRPRLPSSVDPKSPAMDNYKDWVGTLSLVSTLIATVTFAAGFTMPGGYNNSEPNVGIATMVKYRMFQLFVFCDTLAMFTSLTVVVLLIWAQLGDISLRGTVLKLAVPLLGIALTMMSLAFIAGVYLTVSTLKWLAIGILIMASVLLIVVLVFFFALVFPFTSKYHVFRYITFYFICVVAP